MHQRIYGWFKYNGTNTSQGPECMTLWGQEFKRAELTPVMNPALAGKCRTLGCYFEEATPEPEVTPAEPAQPAAPEVAPAEPAQPAAPEVAPDVPPPVDPAAEQSVESTAPTSHRGRKRSEG